MNAIQAQLDTQKSDTMATTFSQLSVNSTFHLSAERVRTYFGPRGPFVKVSKFKYRRVQTGTRQVSDAELKMRSGKAKVITTSTEKGGYKTKWKP